MTTYYKGNNIGLSYNASAGTWSFNNTPQDFIDPNAFSTPDPKFPTAPTVPDASIPEPPTDPCPPGYTFDKELQQCVPDPNYQNPFRQDNQGGGNEQPFQPGTGVELPKGVNYNPDSLFPYSTDAPTRAQQNEHMLLQSGISLGWLQKDGNGNYVKVPFKVQAGDTTGIGWAGSAMKYFNEKSYNDYFNVLENGWQPEGKGLWDKFLRGNSVYSLKGGMKKTTMSGPGGMDMEVYNYSPEFQEKINQAKSISGNGGMIDRDGNVNINADGKGGYYREDGKFVLNNGQVVSFGSLSAGLNYISKLKGSGLKLSKTLRDRLAKGIDSVNFNPNMLPEGFTKDSLKDILKTYKQEKIKAVDEELIKETEDVSDVGDSVITDVSGDTSDDGSTYTPPGTTDEANVPYGGGTDSSGQGSYGGGEDFGGGSTTYSPPTGFGNPGDAGGAGSNQTETPKTPRCFHPEQLIGNKFIKDLEPGNLINGAKILGMVKLKLDEDMYSLNNVRVTGTHKVKYNNNWIYVSKHPDSFVINDKPEFVYVPIVEGGTFIINNYEFADYDDEHIETLNNKLKVA